MATPRAAFPPQIKTKVNASSSLGRQKQPSAASTHIIDLLSRPAGVAVVKVAGDTGVAILHKATV